MSQSIDFPRTIPAPEAGARTVYAGLSVEGQRSMEAQGLRVASTPELTRRVAALEEAHQRDADYLTTCGVGLTVHTDETRKQFEVMQRQIDALTDLVAAMSTKIRVA